MAESIDQLQIDMQVQAVKANDAIDKFIGKLDKLSTSIDKIDTSKITGLANSVNRLNSSMQGMNNVRTADFTRLANNIQKIGNINVSALNSAASSISIFSKSFAGFEKVSSNASAVGDMAKNISKLGNKGVQNAITNMPRLATAVDDLMKKLSKSPQISDNVIKMTNALANLASQSSKINTAANAITNGLNKTNTAIVQTTKNTFSLSSAIGKFYQSSFIFSRVANGLYASITDTANYIEAFNYYNVAFEKIASDWSMDWEKHGYANAESYAESFTKRINETLNRLSGVQLQTFEDGTSLLTSTDVKNLGLNIEQVTQYASQLASVTNSVGLNGEISLAASKYFTNLAGDISSLYNIDYKTAANNLQSGLIGQSRALYKYGIDITNATLQTKAYELGLEKAVSEMTQAEKMQLRIISILEQSRISWGDLANTINNPSNMIRQFTNNMKECGILLGQIFEPMLKKVLPIINGFSIAIKKLLTNIAIFTGIRLKTDEYSTGFNAFEDELENVSIGFDNATESAERFKGQLQGFDRLNLITTQQSSGSSSGGSSGGSIDLTDEILKVSEEYQKVLDEAYANMENKAQQFAEKFASGFKLIENIVKDFSVGNYFQAGEDVSRLVVGINQFLTNAINNVDWNGIGTKIGEFLEGINWTEVFSSFGQLFWEIMSSAIELWKGVFDAAPIETGILTGVALLKWTGLGAAVSKAVAKMIAANMGVEIAKDAGIMTALKTGLLANFTTALSTLGTNIGLLFENLFAGMAFKDAFVMAFGKMGVEIAGIGTIIGGALLSISNFVKMLQEGFSWLNEALMVVGIGLTAVGAIILGASAMWAGVVAGIIAVVATLVIVIKDNWDSIVAWTSNLFDKVSTFFTDLWEKIKGVWSVVSTWFSENVIEPIVSFFVGFATRVGQVFEGLWIIIQAVWIIVSTWFDENVVQPIINFFAPIVEEISSFFSDLWEDIKNVWDVVSNWFSENIVEPVSSAFETACDKIGGFFTSLWSGIKGGVVGAMNAVIGGIESAINYIVSGINKIIKGFNKVVSWAAEVAEVDWGGVDEIPKVTLSRISCYATGGFPEDGLFFANHNELVGKFTNGRTAVANNEQIVAGIANGVRNANAEQNALLREQNALLRQILAKDTGISTRDVFEAVRNENREYINRNGESAFI